MNETILDNLLENFKRLTHEAHKQFKKPNHHDSYVIALDKLSRCYDEIRLFIEKS